MKLLFSEQAFEEYSEWQIEDRKIIRRINNLLKEISRTPFEGTGKPEPLKGNLSGYWSRRIDDTNRLVYKVTKEHIEIIQCKGHYD
ncbi:MAG TPA: Txe/YoeB family addiction module toxin [Candidatus Avilachnospira avicola]|nr:Txe/YoeB family addiction module toxin [Candidatus Avilachnospira avicola]